MMSSFPVKLMAAIVVALFLVMGDIPTTSALVPYGKISPLYIYMLAFQYAFVDIIYVWIISHMLPFLFGPKAGSRKSLWLVYSRDGSRKTVPREEGSSEGLNTSLRAGVLSPPPSPIKNRQSSMWAAAPPPDQIQ